MQLYRSCKHISLPSLEEDGEVAQNCLFKAIWLRLATGARRHQPMADGNNRMIAQEEEPEHNAFFVFPYTQDCHFKLMYNAEKRLLRHQ